MVTLAQAFPSKYLAAADLDDREHVVQITHVTVEEIGKEKESKAILHFRSKDLPRKGIVLNKVNFTKLATLYGDDSDDWTGKLCTLFSAMVEMQGSTKPAIRIKAPPKGAVAPPAPKASQQASEMDEEIPF